MRHSLLLLTMLWLQRKAVAVADCQNRVDVLSANDLPPELSAIFSDRNVVRTPLDCALICYMKKCDVAYYDFNARLCQFTENTASSSQNLSCPLLEAFRQPILSGEQADDVQRFHVQQKLGDHQETGNHGHNPATTASSSSSDSKDKAKDLNRTEELGAEAGLEFRVSGSEETKAIAATIPWNGLRNVVAPSLEELSRELMLEHKASHRADIMTGPFTIETNSITVPGIPAPLFRPTVPPVVLIDSTKSGEAGLPEDRAPFNSADVSFEPQPRRVRPQKQQLTRVAVAEQLSAGFSTLPRQLISTAESPEIIPREARGQQRPAVNWTRRRIKTRKRIFPASTKPHARFIGYRGSLPKSLPFRPAPLPPLPGDKAKASLQPVQMRSRIRRPCYRNRLPFCRTRMEKPLRPMWVDGGSTKNRGAGIARMKRSSNNPNRRWFSMFGLDFRNILKI
ncbi:unnamed protein product, partial [Mesorhabditis spiculigera]